jgi:hypothetical protein
VHDIKTNNLMEGHAAVAAAKQSSLSKLQKETLVSATLDNQYLLETELLNYGESSSYMST